MTPTEAEYKEKLANAKLAQAKILKSSGRTGAKTAWHSVIVLLTLEIQLPEQEPYQAETTWLSKIHKVQYLGVDETISVKIDKDDPQLIFPGIEHIKYWPGQE